MNKNTPAFLVAGAVFGFILSRVGATDFDAIAGMFLLTDLHLMGVIGLAAIVAGIGLRRAPIPVKPRKPGNAVGGLLFGAGWALTGTCPGTALAQLGEGRLTVLFTLTGILLGTALYRRVGGSVESWLTPRVTERSPSPGQQRAHLA
jgi:uncharacterized membrane protein YedE/YeeE